MASASITNPAQVRAAGLLRLLHGLRLIDSWSYLRRRAGGCDGCGRHAFGRRAMGRDINGDPDAPDVCFFCRGGALVPAGLWLRERQPGALD